MSGSVLYVFRTVFGQFVERFVGHMFDQNFGQVFDQSFGQAFDQGFEELKKHINKVYSTTRPNEKAIRY